METTRAFDGLVCTDCEGTYGVEEPGRCPSCGGPLDPVYEYDAVSVPADLPERRSMWRYEPLLPFPERTAVTAAEGGTPAVDANRIAEELGVERVLLKDEARNPTGTVLDRGFALALAAARDHDADPAAHASPGNGAQSAAAYASRADVRSYGFVPSRTPFTNKAMVNVHGGEMRVVGGRYDDAVAALHEDLATDWYSLQAFTTPYRHEGLKTVAYELAETLGWTPPDAVVVPVGTGELLVGVEKGFRELRTLGVVETVPDLYAVQPEGCAPIVEAHARGGADIEAVETPDTIVGELEIPDPEGGVLALEALGRAGNGSDALAVTDDDALASAVTIAQHEVIEAGTSGGVATAGAWEAADAFDGDETVAILNPDAGGKTADVLRSHLMGQGI